MFELGQAFLGRGAIADRVREFRAERVGRLVAGDTPVLLQEEGKHLVCVHLIPHVAMTDSINLDLPSLLNHQRDYLQPLFSEDYGWQHTSNLDGLLTHWPSGDNPALSYHHLYRSGVVESVTCGLLTEREGRLGVEMHATSFARDLGKFLDRARALMTRLDIAPPASLYVSLLGTKGASLLVSQRTIPWGSAKAFDRDPVLLRELPLTDWEGDDLRPALTNPRVVGIPTMNGAAPAA